MAVVAHTEKEVDLLARLMRAEAEGDGNLAMLMVGNVGINRVIENCLDFGGIRNIQDMVFQSPGGFEATKKGYFYQRAREHDKELARRVINGGRFHPARRSLWFFMPAGNCPAQWYGQWNSGRYKSHCFFSPLASECPRL
ncbi:cell wall hydrolase [Amphibacillus sp. MSJ-3]|uniref:cell wall hydrolase n=1 Tax=Amphibacillus sp. MSJ-3 TaxID=2841505 RepID=UPI001C0F38F8|nr:cell wall hydrolase [Amphibacillus sp. MSJ-3]MBU5594830.1 cell wall hydrolase [Amphibacillus sp. MSJ-3]